MPEHFGCLFFSTPYWKLGLEVADERLMPFNAVMRPPGTEHANTEGEAPESTKWS